VAEEFSILRQAAVRRRLVMRPVFATIALISERGPVPVRVQDFTREIGCDVRARDSTNLFAGPDGGSHTLSATSEWQPIFWP